MAHDANDRYGVRTPELDLKTEIFSSITEDWENVFYGACKNVQEKIQGVATLIRAQLGAISASVFVERVSYRLILCK